MADDNDLIVQVKPLVWLFYHANPETGFLPHEQASGFGGNYLIEYCQTGYDFWMPNQVAGRRFDTLEAAKAAAQADYEARILSALDVTPAPTLAEALQVPEIKALVDFAHHAVAMLALIQLGGENDAHAWSMLSEKQMACEPIDAALRRIAEGEA